MMTTAMDYQLSSSTSEEHYGPMDAPRRVWISVGRGGMLYYYVQDEFEAMAVIDKYGDGADAAGREERIDVDEWAEWYDDRGSDIDDLMDERDEDGLDGRDLKDLFDRLAQ